MDITQALNHIGYVICFWGVWKSLDVTWNLLRVDTVINMLLGRQSDIERQVAGKLSFYNDVRREDEKAIKKTLLDMQASIVGLRNKLTPEMDNNLRSTVYGLYERMKLITDGLKLDHELSKEVEKLKKKIHELTKAIDGPTPCVLPESFQTQQAIELKESPKTRKRKTKKDASLGKTPAFDGKVIIPMKYRPGLNRLPKREPINSNLQGMLENIKDEAKAKMLLTESDGLSRTGAQKS